ncbi:MAG: hypothetical protein LBV22_01300, partial [Mycoplasmataceae bacterium]|nr:hypothetical protein [Mycoplasmataceae bacterium]
MIKMLGKTLLRRLSTYIPFIIGGVFLTPIVLTVGSCSVKKDIVTEYSGEIDISITSGSRRVEFGKS